MMHNRDLSRLRAFLEYIFYQIFRANHRTFGSVGTVNNDMLITLAGCVHIQGNVWRNGKAKRKTKA